jgi:hypothetical protein
MAVGALGTAALSMLLGFVQVLDSHRPLQGRFSLSATRQLSGPWRVHVWHGLFVCRFRGGSCDALLPNLSISQGRLMEPLFIARGRWRRNSGHMSPVISLQRGHTDASARSRRFDRFPLQPSIYD